MTIMTCLPLMAKAMTEITDNPPFCAQTDEKMTDALLFRFSNLRDTIEAMKHKDVLQITMVIFFGLSHDSN